MTPPLTIISSDRNSLRPSASTASQATICGRFLPIGSRQKRSSSAGMSRPRVENVKDAGDRLVELGRNPLSDVDRVVEGAGKRLVLDDRDAVACRNLADA